MTYGRGYARLVSVIPMIFVVLSGMIAVVAPGGVRSAHGQVGDEMKTLRQEIEALKAGQSAIQKEIQELKSLLQARHGPPVSEAPLVNIEGRPFKGDARARVTLVEFSDYQCPFCARHVRDTLPQIERDYVASGKVKYVFRDFPLEAIHRLAFKAHEAAHCAGEEGKYWEMHDRLFASQKALLPKNLPDHARELGLDPTRFQECLDSGKHAASIRKDVADGQAVGVRGTPSFFLGLTEPGGSEITARRVIRGAHPYASFKDAIEALLSSP